MGILGRFRLDGKKALVTIRHGIRVNVYVSKVGRNEWLLDQCGLSARKIAGAVRKMFGS